MMPEAFSRHVALTMCFEYYARYLWPLHRRCVAGSLSARCRRCIISERCTPLSEGLCEDCRNGTQQKRRPLSPPSSMAAELDALFKDAQGKGPGGYDALLLFSGGKDSALLLYELRTRYPELRVLPCCIDTGFMSPVALRNVQYARTGLGIELLTLQPPPGLFARAFRAGFLQLGKRGCYQVIDRIDGDLVHDIGRHLAAQMEIPLLLSALSAEQVRRVLGLEGFESPPGQESQPRRTCGDLSVGAGFAPADQRWWWEPQRYRRIARVIFPFYVWQFEEQEIRTRVSELGLIPAGRQSPLLTNNALVPLMGAADIANLGYSSFEPEFAALVRAGKASRGYWLNIFELMERAGQTGFLIKAHVKSVLRELDLTREQVKLCF